MNDIVPCLGVVGSLTVIFGFLAFLRYMRYKETIALAEKGLTTPEPKSSKALLRWGIEHWNRKRLPVIAGARYGGT